MQTSFTKPQNSPATEITWTLLRPDPVIKFTRQGTRAAIDSHSNSDSLFTKFYIQGKYLENGKHTNKQTAKLTYINEHN